MIQTILCFLTLAVITCVNGGKEFDDHFLRRDVNHGMVVHIINVERQCSLVLFNATYPYKYPSGRGSSRQNIIGCVPIPEDLDTAEYLWMVEAHPVKENYNPVSPRQISRGSKLLLASHRFSLHLNSHNVEAGQSRGKYEVELTSIIG